MDKDLAEKSLTGRNVKPFDITGKPMAGWKGAAGLAKWMTLGKEFALSLPEKKGKKKTLGNINIKDLPHGAYRPFLLVVMTWRKP